MTDDSIFSQIFKLDTSNLLEQEKYWSEIHELNIDFTKYFLQAYPKFRKWQGRVHLVFSCIRYARINENAFKLGILALSDKATLVRYRGACILAYSLREDAIPYLKKNLNHPDLETQKDCKRAIKAIKKRNHHIFMEHRASSWVVNESDETEFKNSTRLFEKLKSFIHPFRL
ncbi:hypothetical protein FA048_06520 [Pedobacter polaris]|uniref:HEAT repeat domain-containing protein n=1 Tax=Pedobacter polaris TaxID=2571273 RepID=A0A4U1CQF2_9SPHI|nr:hypothetical protein [Pedobacter polaris]TKC09863.1 hypothetical protein FA048_06520 [Pedobacter polaris]